MEELVLRSFEESDWPEMVRFYEASYGPGYVFTNRKFFDWNFASPFGEAPYAHQHLLLDGARIAGVMGALPWPLQSAGKRVLGAYNINLFVDPAYRGRRAGHRLVAACVGRFERSVSHGYAPRTHSMYDPIGRVTHWSLRRFAACLDVDAALELVRPSESQCELGSVDEDRLRERLSPRSAPDPDGGELTLSRIERFGPAWDAAWERFRSPYGFTTWRSSAFLNWRYIDYPMPLYECHTVSQEGRIAGLVALRIERPPVGPIVRIVDLVGAPEMQGALLRQAKARAREEAAILVDYLVSGAVNESLLEESGFGELLDDTGASLLPMDFNPLRWRDEILTLAVFRDPDDPGFSEIERDAFYVVKGDGDQDRAN